MDSSDDFFNGMFQKHEMAEKKDKLRETDKMIHARNKLKARIEMLEMVDEYVWLGHIEKLLKKAARYAGDEGDEEAVPLKNRMTENELMEQVQRLVLFAGIQLVKRKSAEQVKEDLIDEGKDLLHKYNKTLRM